jgi:hypothetical protein
MPKRSNDFQELVAMIQRALMPEGARITESRLEDGREIDVLIESAVGPYDLRIAVEAKNETRKMDIAKFESYIGKYLAEGGVRVNKVVVVARNGFTPRVFDRAKQLDIELITVTEAVSLDWTRITPPISCLQSSVSLDGFAIDAESAVFFGDESWQNGRIYGSSGWQYGTLADFARNLFWKRLLRECRDQLLAMDAEVQSTKCSKEFGIKLETTSENRFSLAVGARKREISEFKFRVQLTPRQHAIAHISPAIQIAVQPYICKVEFVPAINGADDKRLLDDFLIRCSCCGRDHGTVRQWSHKLAITDFLARDLERQSELKRQCEESERGQAHMRITTNFPPKYRIVAGEKMYAPKSVTIQVHAGLKRGIGRHSQYQICKADGSTSIVDAIEAVLGTQLVRIVLPDGLWSKRIAFRLDTMPNRKEGGKKESKSAKKRRSPNKRKSDRAK